MGTQSGRTLHLPEVACGNRVLSRQHGGLLPRSFRPSFGHIDMTEDMGGGWARDKNDSPRCIPPRYLPPPPPPYPSSRAEDSALRTEVLVSGRAIQSPPPRSSL